MNKIHNETIVRLRHWLDLAEGNNAIGDNDGLSSKLMLIRAEVESALNLRRAPAEEPAAVRVYRYKLNFKYAAAAVLLVVALFVSVRAIVDTGIDRNPVALSTNSTSIEDTNVVPFNEGSEDIGSTSVFNLPEVVANPETAIVDNGATTSVTKAPEGRKVAFSGRKNRAGGNGLIYSSGTAAADTRNIKPNPPAEEPVAQPEPETSEPVADSAVPDTNIDKPKLDPLTLIATLDAHFDETE